MPGPDSGGCDTEFVVLVVHVEDAEDGDSLIRKLGIPTGCLNGCVTSPTSLNLSRRDVDIVLHLLPWLSRLRKALKEAIAFS